MGFNPIGLQLYTARTLEHKPNFGLVHNPAEDFRQGPEDYIKTIKRIKDIGVDGLEIVYGLIPEGLPIGELRDLTKEQNLAVFAAHVNLADLMKDNVRPKIIEDLKELDCPIVIAPWFDPEKSYGVKDSNADGPANALMVYRLRGELDYVEGLVAQEGFKFGVHNHNDEFRRAPYGKMNPFVMDILVGNSERLAQTDIYWVAFAGYKPNIILEHHSKKEEIIHAKDGSKPKNVHDRTDQRFWELGDGELGEDLEEAIAYAKSDPNIKIVSIEQDKDWVNDNPIESIERSFAWLRERW